MRIIVFMTKKSLTYLFSQPDLNSQKTIPIGTLA